MELELFVELERAEGDLADSTATRQCLFSRQLTPVSTRQDCVCTLHSLATTTALLIEELLMQVFPAAEAPQSFSPHPALLYNYQQEQGTVPRVCPCENIKKLT